MGKGRVGLRGLHYHQLGPLLRRREPYDQLDLRRAKRFTLATCQRKEWRANGEREEEVRYFLISIAPWASAINTATFAGQLFINCAIRLNLNTSSPAMGNYAVLSHLHCKTKSWMSRAIGVSAFHLWSENLADYSPLFSKSDTVHYS